VPGAGQRPYPGAVHGRGECVGVNGHGRALVTGIISQAPGPTNSREAAPPRGARSAPARGDHGIDKCRHCRIVGGDRYQWRLMSTERAEELGPAGARPSAIEDPNELATTCAGARPRVSIRPTRASSSSRRDPARRCPRCECGRDGVGHQAEAAREIVLGECPTSRSSQLPSTSTSGSPLPDCSTSSRMPLTWRSAARASLLRGRRRFCRAGACSCVGRWLLHKPPTSPLDPF
jgi:hypothetical protein